MKCPIDNTTLVITHRNNVEIDYCPKCRGIWLDRGELDKIIDQASHHESKYKPQTDKTSHYSNGKHKKKKSFLGDMFDFDLFD